MNTVDSSASVCMYVPVSDNVHDGEVGQLADLGRQLGQVVGSERENLERGELPDGHREREQRVLVQNERLQPLQTTYLIWYLLFTSRGRDIVQGTSKF